MTFGYTPNVKIIKNLSFELKKGERIAILGETGDGKTTIVKLLMRFYDVDSGIIKIDGVDIKEYGKHSLRFKLEWFFKIPGCFQILLKAIYYMVI